MKYPDSWSDAVSTVIGFGGDVDTLGAIVGGLMGARLGLSSIPQHLVEQLVDREKLIGIGEKYYHLLIGDFGKESLIREYV
jgi:ADP-ribosylglycohydrolase